MADAAAVASARAAYAEELRITTGMRSGALATAFAGVPRERFVGAGPWRIRGQWMPAFSTTENADPRHVYHDVLIALDPSRRIHNGQPSLWAFLLDKLDIRAGERVLHLGCGTGYYTAIMAELVGQAGRVAAFEIMAPLYEQAREALSPWPQISITQADAASLSFDPADVVVASAGATHPPATWLDALAIGGRLLVPLTSSEGLGAMLLVTRQADETSAARFMCGVAFVDFAGARDPAISPRLAEALRRDRGASVRSLRREPHEENETCWLHGDGWCLSRRAADR